ncbi:MAG: DUF2309 domain-containing protein [Nitrospirae bacterium]|nr:DUF2309 domain-containing protein [Nitrospirota bacterium]
MEPIKRSQPYSDAQRMQLRGLILLSSEIIAPYWPMRTFVHHNPLHGLEELPFEEAARRARQLLGGRSYLPNELFRDYVRSGRILPDQIDAALKPRAQDKQVALGNRTLTHFELLRAHLLQGISAPPEDVLDAMISRRPDRTMINTLADRVARAPTPDNVEARGDEERAFLGRQSTLAAWCDRTLGTQITEKINREMIKWCEAFLDEEHAAWSMPGREKGFYGAWKFLGGREWSPCGISDSRRKIGRLPPILEDALLEHLGVLGIPSDAWPDYFTLHFAALPGWAGFIKWRADQTDYEWQQAYPIDLAQYLAVRFWYERELVEQACRKELGIDGNVEAITRNMDASEKVGAVREPPQHRMDPHSRSSAWRLSALADALEISPAVLMETAPEELKVLLDWLDAFPESAHGPVWLKAFETGYQELLFEKLRTNLSNPVAATPVRPQAQAVFCIDVRSESFRRHLEAVGDYDTFGFAGFFSVFIRYRAMGGHHDTDQFPVIMKAKNFVREVPRPYQSQLLSRHRARTKLLQAGHAVLHDLKENVVTPYVMVESLGWFYSLPLIGKTVFAAWYQAWAARLRRVFVPPVATSLTVDKLLRKEVTEMLAAEQRGIIRRALQERFGDRDLNLSLERLEFLRKRALGETDTGREAPKGSLSSDEEAAFIEALRTQYRINQGGAFARMESITRMGFTPNEQAFTVETALRMMGLTGNFARLVLLCGHGSTSDNNPFEAALDCGACGGNTGKANARVLAVMANKPQVREALAKNGLLIPQDTYFIAGQHDTTTDTVELFDLEDIPHTHLNDLLRLNRDLEEAGRRNSQERCARFPEIPSILSRAKAAQETRRRSGDWSQVRPEWGLSGNAAFIIGRRELTQGVDLGGRAFLHSYDYRGDATGRLLEIVLTGPQVVGQWINMEHYFSTVDPDVYGSGSKIYHNVVGRFGVMSGPQSDLRTGLARQTVMNGERPFHEPMRLLTLIEAPRERILQIIHRHRLLQHLYDNEWVRLAALDPEEKIFYRYIPKQGWTPERRATPP